MISVVLLFTLSLALLIASARFFTKAAEKIGIFLGMHPLVIGIFIVGIGTSLPELVSGIVSVQDGLSEVVAGNIFGANISNILLITGTVALVHHKDIILSSKYIFIDLHYLIGSVFAVGLFAFDGVIEWKESILGLLIFLAYSMYLLKNETSSREQRQIKLRTKMGLPWLQAVILILGGLGIYLGADYTIQYLSEIAVYLQVPPSIVALTVLSLGTTLPELVVNVSAIRQGKAEMAIGNILGSSVFNSIMVPSIASFFGPIHVPDSMLHLAFPVLLASALFFYLITHDKRISRWEGMLFVLLYILFLLKVVEQHV
ncbi:MAG: sodium:calcium antiporter [Bacteroidetes bacterium]|nr:sodium:calcium antiporter [Bacteroidota bacterium]